MLLHIRPCLMTTTWLAEGRRLVDLTIPEIGASLREGRELMAKTPYPNKHLLFACAKGRGARPGLLLDVGDVPDAFTVVTRWAVGTRAVIVHELRLELADRKHEVIAGTANDWETWGTEGWIWDSVRLPWMTVTDLDSLDARMNEIPGKRGEVVRPAVDQVKDGLVVHRSETMLVPTIEQDRYDWLAEMYAMSRSEPSMPTEPLRVA